MAATDAKPKLRYPAGKQAQTASDLAAHRAGPAFDTQIHKFNHLAS